MFLYHFSNYDFKVLKPSYFGKNYYSRNEAQACAVKRVFCYGVKKPLENLLSGASFCYTVKIDSKKLYDIDKDKKGLKEAFNYDITRILKALIKQGFHGAKYETSFKCYTLFKAFKVKKEVLKAGIYDKDFKIN